MPNRGGLEVDEQRPIGFAVHRGQLIHQPGRDSDEVVLTMLRNPCGLAAIQFGSGSSVHCQQCCALEGSRGRQPCADGHIARHRHHAAHHRMPGIGERPERPGRVCRPAIDIASTDITGTNIDGKRHAVALSVTRHGHRIGPVGLEPNGSAPLQRDGQRETQVVVGVLADEVDAARCSRSESTHDAALLSLSAACSGVTSVTNASIADSDAARYFSFVSDRRIDINSMWK